MKLRSGDGGGSGMCYEWEMRTIVEQHLLGGQKERWKLDVHKLHVRGGELLTVKGRALDGVVGIRPEP